MDEKQISYKEMLRRLMIEEVPSYANKFLYSLGFLSMTSLVLLLVTGVIMVFFGPDWWFTDKAGVFTRSLHLWSVQALVILVILHGTIVFFTSGFKAPRQLTWVIGVLMFFFILMEAEFGYVLRDDFSSQWRSLQGADLYNGSGLGRFLNNLNYAQIYGIHIVFIPFILLGLIFLHYLFIKMRGIAKPYRKDLAYHMVKANHTVLFIRGIALVLLLIVLAIVFPSPLLQPYTIKSVAENDPGLIARTFLSEINHSSDTATYMDTIDPYAVFDTKIVYVDKPYQQALMVTGAKNMLIVFNKEQSALQTKQIKEAGDYYDKGGKITTSEKSKNPLIPVTGTLVLMAQSGLYEGALRSQVSKIYDPTYVTRFLADTGILEDQATKLGITTPQYGMLREEKGEIPPGAWWLAPLGFMDNTILQNDDNQDRDGAIILGTFLILGLAFPYIPGLNRFPEPFRLYRLIWRDKETEKKEKTS
ncbi:MAG: cytochrome b N-terminal domain-containing protein [Patescibacteria group bacterium]|nr:cytochrome b N-terminal domain-containing protein [Patescibacteria group bacterium]MDE2589976.1 cytochrome b N-terminal domain-containing protein [Patescibacteria group bacterium]